jgi:hypothetical protein
MNVDMVLQTDLEPQVVFAKLNSMRQLLNVLPVKAPVYIVMEQEHLHAFLVLEDII